MDDVIFALKGVEVTPLKKVYNPKGDIYHFLKENDKEFSGFGEAYFTHIHSGDVKGWKKHKKMTMNLVVPIGLVRFYFYDETSACSKFLDAGPDNYIRITVSPGVWVAFKGLAKGTSLILNVSNILHDPSEAENKELEAFPLESK